MKERINEEIDIVEKIALKYEGSTEIWKFSEVLKMKSSDIEKDIIAVANGFLKHEEDRFAIGDFEVWHDCECAKNDWKKGISEATEQNNWDGLSNLILEEALTYLSSSNLLNQKKDFKVGFGLVRIVKWRMSLAGKEIGDKEVQ